jgi:hypothetical protein
VTNQIGENAKHPLSHGSYIICLPLRVVRVGQVGPVYVLGSRGGRQANWGCDARIQRSLSEDDIWAVFASIRARFPQTAVKQEQNNEVELTAADKVISRSSLVREALRLEDLTVGWMVIEAGVAISAGVAAHSVTLVAFGVDSLIELASAIALIWRLTVELRHGQPFADSVERHTSRIGGALLFALAACVVLVAGWKLWTRQGQEFSWLGLIIAAAAIPIMWILWRRKLGVAAALGSRALKADAVESIACGWLSSVVIAGLLAQMLFGAWWIDSMTSLGIVWLLFREGREAWKKSGSE